MKRKVYFVGEGTVNGETMQTAKFNQVINPDTREQIFEDVFQITDCADFEKYEQKEEFIATVLAMAYEALSLEGEVKNEIIFTAIEESTNIFLWGVKVNIIDDDNFQYTTLDWKSCGVFIYADSIKKEQFVKEISSFGENTTFDLESEDSGTVFFALSGCKVNASLEDGIDGEITFFKPLANAEVRFDFDIIEEITKQDNTYTLSFSSGLSDVNIEVIQ